MSPKPVFQNTREGVQFTIERTESGDHNVVIDGTNIVRVGALRTAGWSGDDMEIARRYARTFIDGVVDSRVSE